ncbi:MAG: hypothetical protein ACM3XZ_02655 [Betaproteobacteria bacterium]
MKLRQLLFSWDTIAALIGAAVVHAALPESLPGAFVKDVYGAALSMLSIMFSVFFAALAIIISSGDNDFIRFLEDEGHYTAILATFRVTLGALFVALVASLILFADVSFRLATNPGYCQDKAVLALYALPTTYALVAAVLSVWDAMKYAHFRTQFTRLK